MKNETLNSENKNSIDISKPEILDDFWKDCIDQKDKKYNSNTKSNQKSNELNIITEIDNQKQSFNNKSYINAILFDPQSHNILNLNSHRNKSSEKNKKYLMKIYNKHSSFIEEIKNQKIKKIKSKNALNRCLSLYSYGLELQKNMKLNKENSENERKKNDIKLCTFKPKINRKILYIDDKNIIKGKYNRLYNNNKSSEKNLNNSKKQKGKSMENIRNSNYLNDNKDFEECTFKPKFVKNPSQIEKIIKHRKNKKSISERRENEEFILRYTKARDEYLIRRFKKLYKKDDSYDNSLLSLTKRLCNQQYKNYLNVNNTILLFGETINTNNFIHSSIADFRGLTIANTVPEKKKKKIDYVIGLRKNLHDIDLNESDND
jgi:hypothetical protein